MKNTRGMLLGWLSLAVGSWAHAISLSPAQLDQLAKKIWQREGGQKIESLTFWSKHEPFPSCGIGHFIWFPPEYRNQQFSQTFPALIKFLQAHGVHIPRWLQQAAAQGCPWRTREEFYQNIKSAQMHELRTLLASTIRLQAEFIVAQFEKLSLEILNHAAAYEKKRITHTYQKLCASTPGIFAMIDYVNFKGAGINAQESYCNQGWGLLHVLQRMRPADTEKNPLGEFCTQAKQVLTERVKNSQKRQEQAWLPGWLNRIDTYQESC